MGVKESNFHAICKTLVIKIAKGGNSKNDLKPENKRPVSIKVARQPHAIKVKME